MNNFFREQDYLALGGTASNTEDKLSSPCVQVTSAWRGSTAAEDSASTVHPILHRPGPGDDQLPGSQTISTTRRRASLVTRSLLDRGDFALN
ncbi:hypothetical protein PGT21_026996 [Puccinia graminis f. sp. tritici]|uniref:Uncharacterized protein n=1 Tax=Puccinia graminis f. sp. tritici TaxID=56615 RepID=A0A5B0NH03_PUCGR|nr:hypothetical protein PGT21_026996 [Puccinia graminis f. sp. tritici]